MPAGKEKDLLSWIDTVFEDPSGERVHPQPAALSDALQVAKDAGGVLEQTYRRIPLDQALEML